MAIFFQHVGEQGGKRDFPKTIGTPSTGLMQFQLDQLPELTEGVEQNAVEAIERELRMEAPEGFQLWGIPSGARSVISNLRKDNWLLLLESDGPGGQFFYGGRVIYRPTQELFALSRRLWGEARFPLIVLLVGRLTDYPWEQFRSAFGFAPNWRLAGNTYRLTPERISRSQFATEADVIAAVVGKGSIPAVADEIADETFSYVLDQVELLQQSLEGRKLLREHVIRERDPALIRAFTHAGPTGELHQPQHCSRQVLH
jgi:5-methylcytosine-specific restriction enzyme A